MCERASRASKSQPVGVRTPSLYTYLTTTAMKRLISLFITLAASFAALAQTPEEIVARMDQEMKKHDGEGFSMVVEVKLPVLGTMSTKSYMLGSKCRMEATMKDITLVYWYDETTERIYDSKSNEIKVKALKGDKKSGNGSEKELLEGISEGYDLSLEKETDSAWQIRCKKAKSNTDKDAPKSILLTVSKKNYFPLSISTKVSGINTTMRDFAYGVTEKQVTFNPADFPDAKIVDER